MSETQQGWIMYDEYGSLVLSEKEKDEYPSTPVAEIFEEYTGKRIAVSYYITDMTVTPEEALTASVVKDLGGDVKAEFILDAYSSWTIMEHKQEAVVGGHDLIDELDTYDGKYCTLLIEVNAEAADPASENKTAPQASQQEEG